MQYRVPAWPADIMQVMDVGELTDEDLVRQCQSSDGDARRRLADELFRRYYEKVGCLASITFSGQRQLHFPINDNYL